MSFSFSVVAVVTGSWPVSAASVTTAAAGCSPVVSVVTVSGDSTGGDAAEASAGGGGGGGKGEDKPSPLGSPVSSVAAAKLSGWLEAGAFSAGETPGGGGGIGIAVAGSGPAAGLMIR